MQAMTKPILKVLKAYLILPAQDKLQFLSEITKIEKMSSLVQKDYIKTLLL